MLDDEERTVEALIRHVVEQTPRIVAKIESMLPAGFPASVSDPTLRGLEHSAKRLMAGQ